MLSTNRITFIFLALFAYLAAPTNAKSVESSQTKVNYFENIVNDLNELEQLPFVGNIIGPYVDIAKDTIEGMNNATDGSLSTVINSIMPCDISSSGIKCQGTIDRASLRSLVKKLLNGIPRGMLPPTLTSIIQLASDMI